MPFAGAFFPHITVDNIFNSTDFFRPYEHRLITRHVKTNLPGILYVVLPLRPLWKKLQGGIARFFDDKDNADLSSMSFLTSTPFKAAVSWKQSNLHCGISLVRR